MNEISTILIEQINRAGPIRISDYMEICLMHPKCGYYSKKDPFGTKGDFVTSPEISQVFGELLGLCLAQNWLDQGTPSFALVEAGPGRGTLMADILRATKSIPGFHQSMTIHLIEKSQTLIRIQGEQLSKYNVEWH
ncbi:MAG: SAM-dependent methyltransferase, partial [Paracoccaceae bacterium]